MKRSTDTALFLCLGFFLGGGARLGAQETIDFLVPDTWSGYTLEWSISNRITKRQGYGQCKSKP